jgi:hypothetical protein
MIEVDEEDSSDEDSGGPVQQVACKDAAEEGTSGSSAAVELNVQVPPIVAAAAAVLVEAKITSAEVVSPPRPAVTAARSLFGGVSGPSPHSSATQTALAGKPVVPLLPPPPGPSPRTARANLNLERRAAARSPNSSSPPDARSPGTATATEAAAPTSVDETQSETVAAETAPPQLSLAHPAEKKSRRKPLAAEEVVQLSADGALELIRDIREIVVTALAASPPHSRRRS